MGEINLDDILVTALKRIPTTGGDVLHALKYSDPGFSGFGEAYFSWVEPGVIKAWKRHRRITLNLIVPLGQARFVFHDAETGFFREEWLGEKRYIRLSVPPGIWFGFQGKAPDPCLLLNLADLPHDPEELDRKPLEGIPYPWNA